MPRSSSTSRFANGLLPLDISRGEQFARIHWKTNGPVFFGPKPGSPPTNRFDAPAGEFRVLYGAIQLPGAFIETVLRRPGRVMRRSEADERAATWLQVQRPLRLAKIFDEGLHWHGVHAGEISVDDYGASRQLALDLYRNFPTIDGLAYRSRYDNGQVCYAIFNRVHNTDLIPSRTLEFSRASKIVDDLMKYYGAVFDTSHLP